MDKTVLLSSLNVCNICGRLLPNDGICTHCINQTPWFDYLRSWAVYNGPLRNAIHRFKYQNDLPLADTFALYLIQLYNNCRWAVDIVAPVPLSKKRFNERGYNQSAYLALPVSLAIKKPVTFKAVMRIRDTHPQFDLTIAERKQNVADAFQSNANIVSGKSILLIDDISTTGATINSCAKSLKEAGARSVYALTVSYAL